MIAELLQGIRVVKYYAWEAHFLAKIDKVRDNELRQLAAKKFLDAGCVFFWATTPILMSVLTFVTYAKMGDGSHQLTPAKVFTSLALFNMLISPLNSFPWVSRFTQFNPHIGLSFLKTYIKSNTQGDQRNGPSVDLTRPSAEL